MVAMYVDGAKVGTLADAAAVLPKYLAERKTVELRDDAGGRLLGTFTPEPACPWEPDLTRAEVDRRVRESKRSSLTEILGRLGAE